MDEGSLGALIPGLSVGSFFAVVLFFIRRADRVTNQRIAELTADRDFWRAKALEHGPPDLADEAPSS